MKRAFITKQEAIELIKEMPDAGLVTGFKITMREPKVAHHQRRFGRNGPVGSPEFVHIDSVLEEDKEAALLGYLF